jgi:transposase
MESTGVFWVPLFQLLDSRGFEVFLVNARHAKAVPGRKTDVKDCQWLQHLHSVGLLDASFRPEDAIVAIRTLSRHRDGLTKTASKCILQMQKALIQMNIHLHHVISDISGETGLRILDAIVNGEYDPVELIKLKSKRIKASDELVIKSLQGDYRRELIFTLKQALEAYRNTLSLIHDCDKEISKLVREFNDNQDTGLATNNEESEPIQKMEKILHFEIKQAFGIDLTRLPGFGIATALQVLSEVGPAGFSKFRSDGAFASWLALCPNHEITGGQVKSSKTRDSKSRLRGALRQSALSLANEKGYFGSMYRRLRAKFGPVKAITALAHRLARLLFHLVTTGQEYDESIYANAEASHKKRQEVLLQRKARALGFSLIPV